MRVRSRFTRIVEGKAAGFVGALLVLARPVLVSAQAVAGAAATPPQVKGGGLVVDAVLVVLVLMSVGVWAVFASKIFYLSGAQARNRQFHKVFWSRPELDLVARQSETMRETPFADLFDAAHTAYKLGAKMSPDMEVADRVIQIDRAIRGRMEAVVAGLERYSGFLASTAASAPFIGLFGTVWGILRSFRSIGELESASLSVVAPGLSEALVATAVGLIAAIPGALTYNFVARRVDGIRIECEEFSAELVNIMASIVYRDRASARSAPRTGADRR